MPMARDFFTMDDVDLSGRTVLLRVDINSPIDPATGALLNDARIREHLLTIRELRGTKVVLLAHQSRPGKRSEEHTSELQSLTKLVCRLLLEQKNRLDTPWCRCTSHEMNTRVVA